jgi:hypothetical protein
MLRATESPATTGTGAPEGSAWAPPRDGRVASTESAETDHKRDRAQESFLIMLATPAAAAARTVLRVARGFGIHRR